MITCAEVYTVKVPTNSAFVIDEIKVNQWMVALYSVMAWFYNVILGYFRIIWSRTVCIPKIEASTAITDTRLLA